jgi:hypothetical protein
MLRLCEKINFFCEKEILARCTMLMPDITEMRILSIAAKQGASVL